MREEDRHLHISVVVVGWPSVILTPMGPSFSLTHEGNSHPSLRSSLSLYPISVVVSLGHQCGKKCIR